MPPSAELAESVDDWEAKEAEDQVMEVAAAETGWGLAAWIRMGVRTWSVDIAS